MTELEKPRRILVIDDNRAIHQDFAKILEPPRVSGELAALDADLFGEPATVLPAAALPGSPMTFELHFASQGEQGVALVAAATSRQEPFSVAFVDMRMPPGWDGVETIRRLWELDPELQCVICTAYSDYSWEEILQKLGVSDKLLLLRKPFDPAEVGQLACSLAEKWRLARHAHLKLEQLRAMVAEQTAQLAESEARYALAAAGANDGLWDWNIVRGEVFYAPRWNAILGLPSDEPTIAGPERWLERVHPDDLALVKGELDSLLSGDKRHLSIEHRILHADGQYRWVACRGAVRVGDDGKPLRAAGSQTDITNRKVAEVQLQFDALHDALTGLPNRALLKQRIEHCLAHRKRNSRFLFATMFIDLDRFKVVNDSLGHLVGDALLVELARRFSRCIRETDTVATPNNLSGVARLGGDEFVVLLEGFRNDEDVLRVAGRLLDSVRAPIVCGEHTIHASLSIGIALGNAEYACAEDMLRDADTALYRAKGGGRARFELFSAEQHAAAVARFEIEAELRRALDQREFVLEYQPIVRLATGDVSHFEALIRWNHPTRGRISPGDFIPVAEDSGLIVPLGHFVVEEACRQLRAWHQQGFEAAVNVNVSSRQFARPEFVEELEALATGLPFQALRIEVTESTLVDEYAVRRCHELAKLGVLVYLDDFGTGYSSLSYLTRLPVHALKIDRSFVSKLTTDPASAMIVQAILMLAATLKLVVVAEGVETEAEAEKLRELGCQYGQGYLWSKAVAPASAVAFLRAPDASEPLAVSAE
jgi:diguanylate cyclase (GGDEF)-like protein/PAS domain S-box-containing protein